MNQPATFTWFARHELNLFWRDWLSMMTAGKPHHERMLALFIAIAVIAMHMLASVILIPVIKSGINPTIPVLVFISGTLLLSFSLMLSQAMESVTRAFYARDDLELIMSSPVMIQHLFTVRILAIAITTFLMAILLAFPFINVLAVFDGPHWLISYGIIMAIAAFSTSIAVIITLLMFATIGPAHTRLAAQLIAAIVGAGFIIGIQIIAIINYGNLSRFGVLTSSITYAMAPDIDSVWWTPAHALMGNWKSFIITIATGFIILGLTIKLAAPGFRKQVLAVGSISYSTSRKKANINHFRNSSPAQTLRHKEWILLKRDPWLISQTLMQILYLIPPAFLLWHNFSESTSALVILAPVIVMATGQLAGGLMWLAVSGEDAPDLISTAPLPPHTIIKAKIEGVILPVVCIATPLIIALAFADLWIATVTAIGVAISSLSSVAIQLWFRKQARRTHFRRRQISSRTATFAEAFSSILWAGTASMAAFGSWFAVAIAIPALIVLFTAHAIAPRQESEHL